MRFNKLGRFVVLLLAVMVLVWSFQPQLEVSCKGVEKPVRNDAFLYSYFSEVLNYFSSSLGYALSNNTYSVSFAVTTSKRLEMIYDEAIYYRSRGIPTRVMGVIPPFYEFSRKLIVLDNLVLKFQTSPSPALAAGIRGLVDSMRGYLNAISGIRLYEGTHVLRFNVNRTMSYLDSIEKLVSMENFSSKSLSIEMSTLNPVLNESVVIFGSAPINGTVEVYILGNGSTDIIKVRASSGMFSTEYTFHRLGNYSVYAVQGGKISNRLNVTVRKIPTTFLVFPVYSTIVNGTAVVSGQLVDLYGHSIGNETITVKREGVSGITYIKTLSNGSFYLRYRSSIPSEFTVSLRYSGDSVHSGTSSSVTVEFTRVPVSISLYSKGRKFYGFMEPPLNCTLEVFVNGVRNFSVYAKNGQFSFSVSFKVKQKTPVYVYYNGSAVYSNATSNVVYILPPQKGVPYSFIFVFVAVAIAGIGLWLHFRRREVYTVVEVERGEAESTPGNFEVSFESIPEAYGKLRELIISKFGMKSSLTPREILRALNGWEGSKKLEFITEIHERFAYAGENIPEDVVGDFMKTVRQLIVSLGGVPVE